MMRPPINDGITSKQLSPWVWHVYLDGNRVGTVSRDGMSGFIARDKDHHSLGECYQSAEAGMQAWADPHDGQSSVTYPPGAVTQAPMPIPPATPGGGEGMNPGALTRAERQRAADLSRTLLHLIDHGC